MNIRTTAMTLAAGLALAAGVLGITGTANAAAADTAVSVTATTSMVNVPDNGHGGVWADDDLSRVMVITKDAAQDPADAAAGTVDYTATLTDTGTFTALKGALTPNQSIAAGLKILNQVAGTVNGTYQISVKAPAADTLTGTVPAKVDDLDKAGTVSATDWPQQAFAAAAGVTVTGGAYSWTYVSQAGETWTDSSDNGDGNLAADGNVTGTLPAAPPASAPFVKDGKWLTRSASRATVGWDNSATGWPAETNGVNGNHCAEVYITGYGFGPLGDFANAHVGFTCDNGKGSGTGYLAGLEPGHTYAMRVVPATGTYGSHQPVAGAPSGYVDVFTLASAQALGLPLS